MTLSGSIDTGDVIYELSPGSILSWTGNTAHHKISLGSGTSPIGPTSGMCGFFYGGWFGGVEQVAASYGFPLIGTNTSESGSLQIMRCLTGCGSPPPYLGLYDKSTGGYIPGAFSGVVICSPSPKPVAAFHATPLSGEAPLQVQFTDDSTNTPTSWIWDFGAGILSDLQNPLVTYLGAGVYTVKLIATNAAGSDQETKTDYITVLNPTPRYKPQSRLNICTPE